MSLKILYVWQAQYPWEVRVEKILTSLSQYGHEVFLLSRTKKNPSPLGDRHFEMGSTWKTSAFPGNPVWTQRIRKLVQENQIDLVIARDILVAPSVLLACKDMSSSRLDRPVRTILDMAEHYPAAMKGWDKYKKGLARIAIHQLDLPEKVEAWSVPRFDAVMTVCEEQSERLRRDYKIAAHKTVVVSNTPRIELYKGFEGPPPARLRRLGHHGYMTPERGLENLLKAFALLKDKNCSLELVLAGAGERLAAIQGECERLQLKIQLSGPYKHSDFPSMIHEIDMGILPYPETHFLDHTVSNKIFDYFACSRPVLASKTQPHRRLLGDGRSGGLIRVDSPENLASDLQAWMDKDLTPFGRHARQLVESTYNWSHDENRLVKLVEEL